ncbi:ABC transporter substrate-binding protein [Brenneria populi subsp. brevivirga]|uniref:ABC transporter substrate-binding protein n=1 Tax=Brenneria populi TaxID=1505588 RepID=UPI002E19C000|nr:ABC transporter substrate-binding protein [Brenneria populi subsp. brevivirga]
MRSNILTKMFFFLLFLTHSLYAADTSLRDIQRKGNIIIGFTAAYPPFESRNEKTGEFEGFDIDLGNAIARELGVSAAFRDAEWQGLILSLNKGDFDILITGMTRTPKREESVDFTEPYYQLRDVVVIHKDNDAIRSARDLERKIVGVQLGSASEQRADKAAEKYEFGEIRRYNYNPEAFLDLEHKRIDAIIVGYPYAVNALKTAPNLQVATPIDDEVSDIAIVTRKNRPELRKQLNEILKKLRENGELDALENKWLTVGNSGK